MNGISSAWSLHRLSHALLLIGLLSLAAVTGCFAPELKTIPAPSKERFSEIKKSVATLLGLQPKTDFEIAALFVAISQLAANADYAEAISTLPLAQSERAYKQLGLLSADRLAATAEAAWQDLEVDTAPEGLRFDSARGPAQLSLSKKNRPASFLTLPSRSSFSRCA